MDLWHLVRYEIDEIARVERLGQDGIKIWIQFDRFGSGGDADDLQAGIRLLGLMRQLRSVQERHVVVRDQQVEVVSLLVEDFESTGRGRFCRKVEVRDAAENHADQIENGRAVVEGQYVKSVG